MKPLSVILRGRGVSERFVYGPRMLQQSMSQDLEHYHGWSTYPPNVPPRNKGSIWFNKGQALLRETKG